MSHGDRFETDAIRLQAERGPHREHSVPIYMTSSFMFESAEHARDMFQGKGEGPIYSRYNNPNVDEFLGKLTRLEHMEDGIATASGMAAMFGSLASFLETGDHVVASRAVFGSTHQLFTQILPKWGINSTYVDPADNEAWERAITPKTRMFFLETPSNPGLTLVDLEHVGRVADSHGVLMNVDNCFATPYIQTPASYGAHIVTHSATKFMDGQGRVLGGAILGSTELIEKVRFFTRHTGPTMSPFNGWVLSKSIETLAVRLERHAENAMALATRLEDHPKVLQVRYPFLASHPQHDLARKQMRLGGGIVTIEIKGGLEAGMRFLNGLHMISLSSNLGDTRSIATHPASTTHSKLSEDERRAVGITPGLVRLSVGLETREDIISDVLTALEKV
ncbi:MAG: trans-sulfuration enzyme family protein [Spirochaetaceae bacterium]